jgi:hypothetical protein
MTSMLALPICLFVLTSFVSGNEPAEPECYVCGYTLEAGTVVSGSSEGCKKEFYQDSQISMMACAGQCFTSYTKTDNSYKWNRGCAPTCEKIDPQTAPNKWKTCCGEDHCNSSTRNLSNLVSISFIVSATIVVIKSMTS